MVTEEAMKIAMENRNKAYYIHDDYGNEELIVQGELMELVRGVNYIMRVYEDIEGMTSDNILKSIIKVLVIERLRVIVDNSFSVDSFIRENVYHILMRELDNQESNAQIKKGSFGSLFLRSD